MIAPLRRMRGIPLLLLIALLASACTVVIPDPPGRSSSTFKTAETAFHILIERHVDKPGSPQLLPKDTGEEVKK